MALPAGAQIFTDSSHNLHYIKDSTYYRSTDFGSSWKKAPASFSAEAGSFFAENSDKTLYLFWTTGDTLFVKESKNAGLSFSRPRSVILDFKPTDYSIRIINGVWHILYRQDNDLYYIVTGDEGKNFSYPQGIIRPADNEITELIKSSELAWVERTSGGQYCLKYLDLAAGSPIEIYKSGSALSNVSLRSFPSSYDITFLDNSQGVKRAMLLRLQKNGLPINTPKALLQGPFETDDFIAAFPDSNQLYVFSERNGALIRTLFGNAAPSIALLSPADNFHGNSSTIQVSLKGEDLDSDRLTLGVKISTDKDFTPEHSWEFSNISPEASLSFPLPDGKYYIKATASDGIAQSLSRDTASFYLDRVAPKITLSGPENNAIASAASAEVKGTLSKKSALSINGKGVPVSSTYAFSSFIGLLDGQNAITVIATDEAGNATAETVSVLFNAYAPQITFTKPKVNAYYKKGSTVLISASISGKTDNLEDETEADVFIDKNKLPSQLMYSAEDSLLTGFITLPNTLAEGIHALSVQIKDLRGNIGENKLSFFIDENPPVILSKAIVATPKSIAIPYEEKGSGLDLSASSIKLYCGSEEVLGKVKEESGKIYLIPLTPINDGAYTLKSSVRDAIGNSGSQETYSINVSSLSVLAVSDALVEAKILTLENGPNPFKPRTGEETVIKYTLSKPADIQIYIFSLLGDLIYEKSYSSAAALGNISWNGKDALGATAYNGVYPYVLVMNDGGKKADLKRGKIIVY